MSVRHLDVFSGEMPVHVFYPFLITWVVVVVTELCEFFMYVGY